MKKYVNGEYIEMTAEEISKMQEDAEKHLPEIPTPSYDELVDAEMPSLKWWS